MFFLSGLMKAARKSVCAIIVLILSFGYKTDINIDLFQGVREKMTSALCYSFYDSTVKLGKNEILKKTESYDIHLAKNEYEACQIAVRCTFDSTVRWMELEFTPFANENGEELPSLVYKESYIACISNKDYGLHPDALIPLKKGETFRVQPTHGINFPFYIEVHALPDTPAGTYTAQIKGRYDDREDYEFIAEVKATVWNFALPDKPCSASAVGIGKGDIKKVYYIKDDENADIMYKKYYDYLLDRNISGYDLPFDILSPEADAYMSDPRVTSFVIPYCGDDDELLVKYYTKVQSNPEWAAKGFFYPVDEPDSPEEYEHYNECAKRLEELCPGYHMATPSNAVKVDGVYSTGLQKQSDIFCGISKIFADEGLRQSAEQRRKEGTDIWWYVCGGPRDKYCNIFTHWEGIRGRLLFWQQKALNINGFLYWGSTYWHDVGTPWHGAHTTPWTGPDTFGDGSLFYPGPDGPLPSMRLLELSDGFDDFDLLTMAETLFGREYIEEKISKVSKSLTDYTKDDSLLTQIRNSIGADIEAAQ